jgi:DNA-directed RNA polymerase subunit RPC12/RpoP
MLIKRILDVTRAGASLQVTCTNCGHEVFIKARFLAARYGAAYLLEQLQPRFRCTRCQGRNVRFGLSVPELAERKLRPIQWFGGVYEKYED